LNQSRAFFISLAFAFVGMGLVAFYISEQERKMVATHGDIIQVIVAKNPINEMKAIDINDLGVQSVPSSYLQPGAIRIDATRAGKKEDGFIADMKELNGMVSLVPIRAGEQLVVTKLSPKGAETGLALEVPANKRALSIPISDDTGVSKLIKPGDHVDIISSIYYPGPDGTKQTELKTLLQNINLLAIGEIVTNNIPQLYETDPLTQKKVPVSGRGDRAFTTVTVEVTPDQAQILIFAMEQSGKLFLTLRNPVDRVETPVGSTTVDEVLGPDSKRAEARDREQRRIMEEARRQAELERLKQQQAAPPPAAAEKKLASPAADPLESGGGVIE
jgi:pilus assembly protein CpaB